MPSTPTCGAGGSRAVWTGTNADGSIATGNTCTGWTAAGATGLMGLARGSDVGWTNACGSASCGGSGAIYCVEQ